MRRLFKKTLLGTAEAAVPHGSVTITATGTWTIPAGVTVLTSVEMYTSGDDGKDDAGDGGGGGAYAKKLNVAVTSGDATISLAAKGSATYCYVAFPTAGTVINSQNAVGETRGLADPQGSGYDIAHDGGDGGNGNASLGGGGGGSGGPSAAGTIGGDAVGIEEPGIGGASGGGASGSGGNGGASAGDGSAGNPYGGGGGGGGSGGVGGTGQDGAVIITY